MFRLPILLNSLKHNYPLLMKWKNVTTDYFTFTRKERFGLMVLAFFILIFFLLPGLVNNNGTPHTTPADTSWITAVKRLETKEVTIQDRKTFKSGAGDNDNAYQYDRFVTTPFT